MSAISKKIIDFRGKLNEYMENFENSVSNDSISLWNTIVEINKLYGGKSFLYKFSKEHSQFEYYLYVITPKLQQFYNEVGYLTALNYNDNESNSIFKDLVITFQYVSDRSITEMFILKLSKLKNKDLIEAIERNLKIRTSYTGSNYDNIGFYYYLLYNKNQNLLCSNATIVIDCIIEMSNEDNVIFIKDRSKFQIGNKLFYYCKNIKDLFKKCQDSNKFSIFYINIYTKGERYGHANLLIYNPNTNEIEYFEPNGCYTSNLYCFGKLPEVENAVKKFIENNISDSVKFIPTSNICDVEGGFQIRFNDLKFGKGICFLWVSWYMKERLKYPNLNAKDAFAKIKSIYWNSKTLVNDMLNFQQELTNERINIVNNEKISFKIRELLKNGWMMQKVDINRINKIQNLITEKEKIIENIKNLMNEAVKCKIPIPLLPETGKKFQNLEIQPLDFLNNFYIRLQKIYEIGKLAKGKEQKIKEKDNIEGKTNTGNALAWILRNLDAFSTQKLDEILSEVQKVF